MSVIYKPRGRALEYSPLALNIFKGCVHGCQYCFAPASTYTGRDDFHSNPSPRADIVNKVRSSAKKHQGTSDRVLLCFTSDPYQPEEIERGITREVITILAENKIPYQILTKGGMLAARDFDIMARSDCKFASTIVFVDDADRAKWEPMAATFEDRVQALKGARAMGIPTWVSLEPVIDPEQSLSVIRQCHKFVDFWKVGMLNHHALTKTIAWKKFHDDAVALLESLGADYYIKNDLREIAGVKK